MSLLVAVFGLAILAAGLSGVASPARLLALVRWESQSGVYVATGLRLALGIVLLAAAPGLGHPKLAASLGVIALFASAGTALLGARRRLALVDWWLGQPAWRVRLASGCAAAFGVLLVALAFC